MICFPFEIVGFYKNMLKSPLCSTKDQKQMSLVSFLSRHYLDKVGKSTGETLKNLVVLKGQWKWVGWVISRISALKFFVPCWGLPGSFLGLPVGFLIYDITYLLSSQEAPRRPPGSYKKFQGRNPGNNFVGILDETIIS